MGSSLWPLRLFTPVGQRQRRARIGLLQVVYQFPITSEVITNLVAENNRNLLACIVLEARSLEDLRSEIKVSAGCMSFGNYRGESISLLIQAVSRFQFLAIIGLRSPFLCWLSAEGSSHLLEAIQIIWLMAPFLHLQSSSGFEVG